MHNQIQFQALDVAMKDLLLPNGLVVDMIELQSGSAGVALDPFGLTLQQPAAIHAVLGSEHLRAYLEAMAPGGIRQFRVWFEDAHVKVEAAVRLLIEIQAVATCRLRIVDERQLFVDLVSVSGPAAAAKGMIESQLERINPVFDCSGLPVSVLLKNVSVESDGVHLRGEVPSRAG